MKNNSIFSSDFFALFSLIFINNKIYHTVGYKKAIPTSIHCTLNSNYNDFVKIPIMMFNHRVDSVIESSLREILGSKNFALINLSFNFCEATIYDNKVFLENLVAVH